MPLPRLIHPIPVVVRLRRKAASKMDPDAREPVGKVARSVKYNLQAQISWKRQKTDATSTGSETKTEGYILLRRFDLDALGIDINEGDKIETIGTGIALVEGPFYITMIQYRGHYPGQGGHTLVKAWFNDKKPVRQKSNA